MSTNERYEGGTEPLRLEWVPEAVEGITPTDPEWNLFSNEVYGRWDTEPDANTQAQRPSGTIKPTGFFNGAETWEASFSWDMMQWFVDASGNTLDPSNDFIQLAQDNSLKTTHTVVERKEHYDGNGNVISRQFTVGKGGHPDEVTVPFETEDGTPIQNTASYQFEKIRKYTITQPSASMTLSIENTGSSSVDVTIEDEGAATTETVTVSAGSTATTTSSFADIDAVELSTDIGGDIIVSDGSGTTFVTIRGSDAYPASEGDLGVPALGAGSHASALAESYVIFLDDTLKYTGGEIAPEIASGELTVSTGINSNTKAESTRQNIHAEEWSATMTISVAGPNVSDEQFEAYLTEVVNDIEWQATEGTLTGVNGRLTSPGSYSPESGTAKLMLDSEYSFEDITIST